MTRCFVGVYVLLVAFATARAAQPEAIPIPELGPAGVVIKVHTGFKFTEGRAADGDGILCFSDIPNDRIHKLDADGKLSTVLENIEGCNGFMVDARNRLVACQSHAKSGCQLRGWLPVRKIAEIKRRALDGEK
jgi:gluconolactonase